MSFLIILSFLSNAYTLSPSITKEISTTFLQPLNCCVNQIPQPESMRYYCLAHFTNVARDQVLRDSYDRVMIIKIVESLYFKLKYQISSIYISLWSHVIKTSYYLVFRQLIPSLSAACLITNGIYIILRVSILTERCFFNKSCPINGFRQTYPSLIFVLSYALRPRFYAERDIYVSPWYLPRSYCPAHPFFTLRCLPSCISSYIFISAHITSAILCSSIVIKLYGEAYRHMFYYRSKKYTQYICPL